FAAILYLHSFPTRRSSDLITPGHSTRGSAIWRNIYRSFVAPVKTIPNQRQPIFMPGLIPAAGTLAAPSVYPVRVRLISPPNSLRSEEHTSELQSRFDLVCR